MTAPSSPIRPATDTARVQALLAAHQSITADLSLVPMLRRIVAAARELVGARYGALTALGPDGSVEQVVQDGLAVAPTIEIQDGDASEVGSLLTVPVRLRGGAFGELYVAEREVGSFDDEDLEVLTALAASASTAIENARLFEQARRSRDWLDAAGAIARALLADADADALLDVVSQALDIAEADYAALILPTGDAGKLKVTVAKGIGAEDFLGHVFEAADSPLGRAIITGRSCRTNDLIEWTNAGFVNPHQWGPAMLAPLVDARGTRGAIVLIRQVGRSAFTPEDVQAAATFATQVALAFEMNDARADAEWLRVVEDRHRIAQDLHDNVMQRLFATGMGLQVLVGSAHLQPDADERLGRHIADLDDTIDQIRGRVFNLRTADQPPLRHQRGRYPYVAPGHSAAESGASRDSTGANPGPMRTLSRPTVPGGDASQAT